MIWKALSDPTRRSILDLLKSAPRTTGEISQYFAKDLSRFAIMKHLGILEKAHLITTRKEGKSRMNYLNPGPIQKTYDEWVDQLIQLKYYTDQTSRKMGQTAKRIITSTIDLSSRIPADQTKVWEALTQQIDQWWVMDFNQSPTTVKMALEPKLGGLLYEDAGKNEGFVWATIIALHSPNHLVLRGDLSPDFGGPAISYLKFTLEEKKGTTILKLQDTIMGTISQKRLKEIKARWKVLLDALVKHCEG